MILGVYAARDALAGFMTPVVEQSDAIAMRNFRMACDAAGRDRSLMSWRSTDFSLYRLATYDTETGVVVPVTPITLVCSGQSNDRSDHDA